MMTSGRIVFFFFAVSLVMGIPLASAQPVPAENGGIFRVESALVSTVPASELQVERRSPVGSAAPMPSRVVLDALESGIIERAARAPQEDGSESIVATPPRQIGVKREILALKSASAAREQLDWQPRPDGGHIAAIAVASPGAAAIRLGVRVFGLPAQALVRVRAPGDDTAIVFEGREIVSLIALNLAAGELGEEAHDWWSPTIEGEEAVLEIILPAGVKPKDVDIAVPRISHLFTSARTDWKVKSGNLEEKILSCHNDVNCETGWDLVSRATAYMEFTDDNGDTYICNGTLMNDHSNTAIPWFLTARHCISSQVSASSLQTYWLHRSAACNSWTTNPKQQVLHGGALLLYVEAQSDMAFLRLTEPAPSEAAFAGWQATVPTMNVPVAGIHHPDGELQKISFGTVSGYANCSPLLAGYVSCEAATVNTNHIIARWNKGTIEQGSSGSGLYVYDNTNKYLVGTLHAGPAYESCYGDEAYYGRFDLAYSNKLKDYLGSGAQVKLTVQLSGTGSGKVTGTGIDCGTDCSELFHPTFGTKVSLTATAAADSVFAGWSGACTGMTPTCTVTMGSARDVRARFDAVGGSGTAMALRDAIYLYHQPISGDSAKLKTLVGYDCDALQILLDVESGYTDIATLESTVASGNAHVYPNIATVYPDRIHADASIFSYVLYTSAPVKTFELGRFIDNDTSATGNIGTVTAFGYCFSTKTDAKVLMHDSATDTCHLSDGTTKPCAVAPDTFPQ
jgi:hypothetical protein